MNWHSFRDSLRAFKEAEIHPHVEEEGAEMFRSTDTLSTELEYLDLLYGIVRAIKPRQVLETGTYKGHSALAMGFAIRDNHGFNPGVGRIISIEKNHAFCAEAQNSIQSAGLQNIVTLCNDGSLSCLRTMELELSFDMVYFDSSRTCRVGELEILFERKLLAPRAILVFHDTSPLRSQISERDCAIHRNYLDYLQDIAEQCTEKITFTLSRGITVFRL